jgi:hypothetical protein
MNKQELIELIRKNKKYAGLSSEIIERELQELERKNPGVNLENVKPEYIMKMVRTRLHEMHGSYQLKESKKRVKYFEELKKEPENPEIIDNILETNRSTQERLEDYSEIYLKIFDITSEPKIILDLGCGINPVSFDYTGLEKETKYLAYDINDKDNDFLNEFFKLERINGKASILDCSKIENIRKLHDADVCFMFKFLDPIEKAYGKGHKLAEEIILELVKKVKFIIISFSKLTVSGNRMNFPYRGWMDRMLERLELKNKQFETENEIFYVINTKNK